MSLDPAIIERYAKLMELKAGSRVARFTLFGILVGGFLGAGPLLAGKVHLVHSFVPARYGFALAIMGAAAGAYLGYLVGQSRAVALRLQAHVAVHQLEVERLIRRLDGLRLPLPEPDRAVLAAEAPAEPVPVVATAPPADVPPAAAVPPPVPIPERVAAFTPPLEFVPVSTPYAPPSTFSPPASLPPSAPPPAPAPPPSLQPMPFVVPVTEPAPSPAPVQALPAPTPFSVPVSEPVPSPAPVSAPAPVPGPQLVPDSQPEPAPAARLLPPPAQPFEWATPPANAVRTNP